MLHAALNHPTPPVGWFSAACNIAAIRNPKKKGHLQKDCFAHKRDKAPMVDANGKPYQNQNNRVNNVAE